MQDIRLCLEPHHNTATFSTSASASSPSTTSSAPASVSVSAVATETETVKSTTAIIDANGTTSSPNRRPLQLLPELNFSEQLLSAATITSSPQQFYHQHPKTPTHQHQHQLQHQHQHQHHPQQQSQQYHHYHNHHQERQQKVKGTQRPIEELQLHHTSYHATCQQQVPRSPSSEEDNSPTEMNNCRRLVDKPPLVKRLTMGIGLLRATEDSRPLVHNTCSSLSSGSTQTISDGYVNEAICEPDKYVANKFGDSCRQSLSALETATQRLSEMPTNKKYLRETGSANSSPKLFAPSAPLRIDSLSLSEQQELKGAAWFQAGIPREISLEVLSRQSPGAFLVRQSSTKPGCFALSLRVPPPAPRVAHYLILRSPRGYKIKGFTKEFSSLRALITHHSVMPELLPVPLALPRPSYAGNDATYGATLQRNGDGDFEMYGSLNDFRKMMADLNV